MKTTRLRIIVPALFAVSILVVGVSTSNARQNIASGFSADSTQATAPIISQTKTKSKRKVRLKGLKLGGKKGKTYIAVDVKVVDTETGEVVDATKSSSNK